MTINKSLITDYKNNSTQNLRVSSVHVSVTWRHFCILSILRVFFECKLIVFGVGGIVRTSSLMIKLGRRPLLSSGGISEPRRLDGPEPGASDPLRIGLFSRTTSIVGASGALISGTLTVGTSWWNIQIDIHFVNTRHTVLLPFILCNRIWAMHWPF